MYARVLVHAAKADVTLLQNTFLVSVDNPFLVSAVLTDTIYTIQKMNDFWYRLFRTDTNNINWANTQFSSGPSVVIVAEHPVGNVLPLFFFLPRMGLIVTRLTQRPRPHPNDWASQNCNRAYTNCLARYGLCLHAVCNR
jgi:hypothetical protein